MDLREQRLNIQQSVDCYFRARIQIAPRAMAALQGTFWSLPLSDDGPPFVSSESVLDGLLQSSPACFSVLCDAGVPAESLVSVRHYVDNSPEPGALLHESLDNIFYGEMPFSGGLNSRCAAYNTVRLRGTLSDEDLLLAFVQTAYRGEASINRELRGSDVRFSLNDLGERLVRSGFLRPHEIVEELDSSGNYRATSRAAQQLIDLQKRVASIATVDASHGHFQFAFWAQPNGRLRVQPFGAAGIGRTADANAYVCREDVFQPSSLPNAFPADAIAELEEMINTTSCAESRYQRFFEDHPEFLTGLQYTRAHPQLVLFSDGEPNRIPDFMLEILSSEMCDLLELKLPHEKLVRRLKEKARVRFRDLVDEGIAQLQEYRRYFDDSRNRRAFHELYGLDAFRPSMILVCGRSHHFSSDLERRELRALLPADLQLWTYDDIVERARRFHMLVSGK